MMSIIFCWPMEVNGKSIDWLKDSLKCEGEQMMTEFYFIWIIPLHLRVCENGNHSVISWYTLY